MRYLVLAALILSMFSAQAAITRLPHKTYVVRTNAGMPKDKSHTSTLHLVLREQIGARSFATHVSASAPVNANLTQQQQNTFMKNPDQFMVDQALAGVVFDDSIEESEVVTEQFSIGRGSGARSVDRLSVYLINRVVQLLRFFFDDRSGSYKIVPLPYLTGVLCEGGMNQLLFTHPDTNRISSLDQNGNIVHILGTNELDPAVYGRITSLQKISATNNEFAVTTSHHKFIRFKIAPTLQILTLVDFSGPSGQHATAPYQYYINSAGARHSILLSPGPMTLGGSNLRSAQMLASETHAWVVLQGQHPMIGSTLYFAVSIDYATSKPNGFAHIWSSAGYMDHQQILDFDGSELLVRSADLYESSISLNPVTVHGDFFKASNQVDFEDVHHPRTGLTWLPTHRMPQVITPSASGGRSVTATASSTRWVPTTSDLHAAEAYIRRQSALTGATAMLTAKMELWKVLRVINLGDQLRLDMLYAFDRGALNIADVVKGRNSMNGQEILEVRTGADEKRLIDLSVFIDAVAHGRRCANGLTGP